MNKTINWIKHHQLIAFFLITFTISWDLGFSYYAINNPGQEFLFPLAAVATCGPALSGIIVTRICNTEPILEFRKPFWIAFPITLSVSAAAFVAQNVIINKAPLSPFMVIFLSIVAIPVAYVLSARFSRVPSIRRYLASAYQVRQVWVWLLLAPIVMLGIDLLSIAISHLLGGESQFFLAGLGMGGAALFLFLEFSNGFLSTGGINEESGWRGFALPRLQARYSVIVAGLIVGYLWSFWHLPYDIGEGVPTAWILQNRLFWTSLFGIIMTWFYNRTNRSLLAPALFHPAMNTFGNNFLITPLGNILFIGLAIYAIVSDRMWKKLPFDHPAMYREPILDG